MDNYDELLKTDDRLGNLLRETIAGGIERTAKRFDLNEQSKALKFVEGTVIQRKIYQWLIFRYSNQKAKCL